MATDDAQAWMKNTSDHPPAPGIDTSVPHSARVWNYWLGGKDNFEPDRAVGEMVKQTFPEIVTEARESRAFLGRAVTYLAGEAGIRQFLDIGTGLPTANNTHEVAQRVAPESRIVYVDNDPLVLVHARALLTSTPEGATKYVEADLAESEKIVRSAGELLDFDRPIAVMFLGILAHVEDYEAARSIVRQIMDAVPSGSYLTISDGADTNEAGVESMRQYNETAPIPYHLRSPEQIAGYFDGLELVDPGVVRLSEWRPDPASGPPANIDGFGGVGRKP
ncbi:MAG TPA: SAM-dependent methyltransferase [Jiangellaceae bacterium]